MVKMQEDGTGVRIQGMEGMPRVDIGKQKIRKKIKIKIK
jgi:hypothetical protein